VGVPHRATLYEGVVVSPRGLTMPDALHSSFIASSLLADLMKCGVAMLSDALSWLKKVVCSKVEMATFITIRPKA